ncbi:MAG: response regulator [Alphaproteobacteria bacterium]|nr:response regulator [Alphaproteobacteria bacterium]
MTYNIPKNYNLNIRLTSLVALFLSLLFISTDVNACCCGLSEVFNHFTRRFTNQRTDQGFAEIVLPPADTLAKPRPSGMHVAAVPAEIGRDKRIVDKDAAVLGETKTAAASETASAIMSAQTPLTALIVDDQSVKGLEKMLSLRLHFTVTVLTSGEAAQDFFDKGSAVDIVFMDYSMGGITGLQATRSIREKHKGLLTKFIIHSANEERDLKEAMAATFVNSEGRVRSLFDGRIPKGPDIDTLKAELVKHFLTDPSEGRKTKFIRKPAALAD